MIKFDLNIENKDDEFASVHFGRGHKESKQKVNPIAYRLGIIRGWDKNWFPGITKWNIPIGVGSADFIVWNEEESSILFTYVNGKFVKNKTTQSGVVVKQSRTSIIKELPNKFTKTMFGIFTKANKNLNSIGYRLKKNANSILILALILSSIYFILFIREQFELFIMFLVTVLGALNRKSSALIPLILFISALTLKVLGIIELKENLVIAISILSSLIYLQPYLKKFVLNKKYGLGLNSLSC